VIEGAIAQTLTQTQTILYRELAPAAGAAGLAAFAFAFATITGLA
jgi:hypothetical protein